MAEKENIFVFNEEKLKNPAGIFIDKRIFIDNNDLAINIDDYTIYLKENLLNINAILELSNGNFAVNPYIIYSQVVDLDMYFEGFEDKKTYLQYIVTNNKKVLDKNMNSVYCTKYYLIKSFHDDYVKQLLEENQFTIYNDN